ncbi:MAG: hypothetical protein FWD33_00600 [Alphaproteobacteria bacterium]|nr:hypothetical protein [Alphaproteobacteria bacterium]
MRKYLLLAALTTIAATAAARANDYVCPETMYSLKDTCILEAQALAMAGLECELEADITAPEVVKFGIYSVNDYAVECVETIQPI